MSTETPAPETVQAFEESVDDAAHAAIIHFEWMGLPEGDQRADLLERLNDAIAGVMREWI